MMEQVLVVKREKLERYIGGRNGLIRDNTEDILDAIMGGHEFMPRAEAEERPDYKQIIPYVILLQGDKVFVTRRLNKGGEARLHGRISIGMPTSSHSSRSQVRVLMLNSMVREAFV